MNLKHLIFSLFLLTSFQSFEQVRLPSSFKCIKSEFYWRDNYYSDGTINLTYEFHNSYQVNTPTTQKEFISNEMRKYDFKFKRTNDNLYVGFGVNQGINFYIILVPESFHSFKAWSKFDDINFD
jgi:hypothetical protein